MVLFHYCKAFFMSFTILGLSDQILRGIRAVGYTTPTPIQSLAIGPALAGKDIMGCAQTGTGKTAAFVLPMLHRLGDDDALPGRNHHPRGLILTPTRELAQQVHTAIADYGRFLTLRSMSIYGGVSMENRQSIRSGEEGGRE